MSGFIRVRAADGPAHEFHAPVGEVEVNPDLYEVVDATVVNQPEEPTYKVPATKQAAAKTEASKPAARKSKASAKGTVVTVTEPTPTPEPSAVEGPDPVGESTKEHD